MIKKAYEMDIQNRSWQCTLPRFESAKHAEACVQVMDLMAASRSSSKCEGQTQHLACTMYGFSSFQPLTSRVFHRYSGACE